MTHRRFRTIAFALLALAGAAACADDASTGAADAPPAETAQPDVPAAPGDAAAADAIADAGADAAPGGRCATWDPLRRPWFGDLHVHTSLSFDAWVYDVRLTPADAYRFARGEAMALAPLDAEGRGTRVVRLDRPLDFAAVTDHAEFLGEVSSCVEPGAPGYDAPTCVQYRRANAASVVIFGLRLAAADPTRFEDLCGADGAACLARAESVWQRIGEAAAAAQDDSAACTFTTFLAYEYSANPGLSNLHRNVIFRGPTVPPQVVSFFDEPSPWGLWRRLNDECLAAGTGCDVLAIPHNSNWSNGNLFHVEYPGAATEAEERELAALRGALEPLVEVFQHKGDSECMGGLAGVFGEPDELCGFEKLRTPPFDDCGDGTGSGAMNGVGCVSRLDFVRNVLKAGLAEEARLGVNPFKLGLIASTDTHNGTPGNVAEEGFPGHFGTLDGAPADSLGRGGLNPGGIIYNPGGLAVVWAEENRRDALFDALRRRETYGTSGPRIIVRFFGGWDYAAGVCDAPDLAAQGYAGGVPMGGDLPPRPAAATAPAFVVSALRDPGVPGRPGTPLQRIQVVKGWLDADGTQREQVFDVAGAPNAATVDPATCEPTGPGHDALCAVWQDPHWAPAERAFYYARVVENPTCRWSARLCLTLPEAERPETCRDPAVPTVVQERAWTSPIWYAP